MKPAPPPPAHVRFELRSEPPGADVLRDGKTLGKTPFTVEEDASAGTVTFVLRADGYDEGRAEFPAGHGGRADVVLTKHPAPPPVAEKPPEPKPAAAPAPAAAAPAPAPKPKAAPKKPKPPPVDL